MNTSRRNFFRQLTGEMVEQVGRTIGLSSGAPTSVAISSSEWQDIGTVADFAPGVARSIELAQQKFMIRSDDQGMWVENSNSIRLALRRELTGKIQVSLKQFWPSFRVLSHLSLEAMDLSTQIQQEDAV